MTNDKNSPISEYLMKLQLIISNTEFKNKTEASKYETAAMTDAAQNYIHAMNETDTFELYKYSEEKIYNALLDEYGPEENEKIMFIMKNVHTAPIQVKKKLKLEARENIKKTYVEQNKYYVNLTGKPFMSDTDSSLNDTIVPIPESFYERYETLAPGIIFQGMPIHELPYEYQEAFIKSEFYEQTLNEYPNARYLRFIGSNAIPIEVSRKARDGDIMKININKLSTYSSTYGIITVSSDIVHKFTQVYNETRDYVFYTLRGDFQNIYPNYDSFIRFLTIYLTLGNCMNEFMKSSTSLTNMNNALANNLFTLYGLPSVIMEGAPMIEFLKNFRLLLMDKGTNVVYRVKDLVGYEYTEIFSLIMVKQQVFENGKPIYYYNETTGESIPKQRIVFRRMGTSDDSNSYFKFRESDKEYLERRFPAENDGSDEREISSGDPRWWESKEVNDALRDMNYTLSNSKYIQLSTHISMVDVWYQSVILLRGLLDKRANTQISYINVNYNINGSSELSVYDAVLCLLIIMNWKLGFSGDLYNNTTNEKGVPGCYDMLFNGLYQGILYQQDTIYEKGTLIGLNKNDRTLYYANTRFRSSKVGTLEESLQSDINNGLLRYYGDINLTPKDLVMGQPFKVASFNFKIKDTEFYMYDLQNPNKYTYLDKATFIPMIDAAVESEIKNVGETIMMEAHDIYKYLETKLRESQTIEEFRQVTDAYNALFLVDPQRDWYDSNEDTNTVLKKEYDLSDVELLSLENAFNKSTSGQPDFTVMYNSIKYSIYLADILNYDAKDLIIEPYDEENAEYAGNMLTNSKFLELFEKGVDDLKNTTIDKSSGYSVTVRQNYREIIKTKVELDLATDTNGLSTFEALLHQTNPTLSKFVKNLINSGATDSIVLFLRSLIKALSNYASTNLSALEFRALGIEEYMRILREVISYFKSYMVEFTKDEFIYLFDNILDNGGNSNMLRLYDDVNHKTVTYRPKDSVALFDVSRSLTHYSFADDNRGLMYDDAIIRLKAAYKDIKNMGYDIWYDDGVKITKTPFSGLNDNTIIVTNLVKGKDNVYKLIIHKSNVNVDNYYGNKRKI